ncbi:asparagine-linked glycosylation protein [Coemansia sp. RSA 720]|nr:asparagine-linked glycosylation protein [Coemansia sp. RSA 638]KAJ2125107.1 asparagine-linked glycosylation protein [Coemansia sp. RSA 720]
MPLLETVIHYSLVLGVVLAIPMIAALGLQVLILGTQSHQASTRQHVASLTRPDTREHPVYYVGFFHPYANAGGGGERVLWTMIKAIQDKYPFVVCVVYAGDSTSLIDLVRGAQSKFGLRINKDTLHVIELTRRSWVEHKYERMTLLLQSVASVVLAAEALHAFVPHVFVDTVGFAFTYPLVSLLSSRIPVVSYTHYPTISSDMQTLVSSREAGVSNDTVVANSRALTELKSVYYRGMATAYAFAGSFASTVMTNSTWTHNHIVKLFGIPRMTRVVYPPCDTTALAQFPLDERKNIIVSLAQFRPEKNHELQIDAFAMFLDANPEHKMPAGAKSIKPADILALRVEPEYPVLVMLGGARNIEDEARAEALRQKAEARGIGRQVHVIVNAEWSDVQSWLRIGRVGIHTMRDEHFGINIVEMMAAGLLTVAHDSAGPRMDIITPAIRCASNGKPSIPTEADAQAYLKSPDNVEFPVGMVATTAAEFAQMIEFALRVTGPVERALQEAARSVATTKFSEAAFNTAFYSRFGPVIRWLDIQRSDD